MSENILEVYRDTVDTSMRVETALTEWKAASTSAAAMVAAGWRASGAGPWAWASKQARAKEAEATAATKLAEAVSEAWPHWAPWVAAWVKNVIVLEKSEKALERANAALKKANALSGMTDPADPGNGETP